jgi:hypothetical protein
MQCMCRMDLALVLVNDSRAEHHAAVSTAFASSFPSSGHWELVDSVWSV